MTLAADTAEQPEFTPTMSMGMLFVLSVMTVPGICAFLGEFSVGGLQATGWLWVAFVPVGMLILLGRMAMSKEVGVTFPWKAWIPWLAILWLSLGWGTRFGFHRMQEAAQLSTPVFTAILCSIFVRSRRQLEVIYGSIIVAVVLLLIGELMRRRGWVGTLEQGSRSDALSATLCGALLFSMFPRRKMFALLGWTLALLVTGLSGSRIATATLLLVPILHPLVRPVWVRGAVLGVLMVLGIALFYSPIFQERFFYDGQGDLSDIYQGNMSDMGRFEAWPDIFRSGMQHPVLGQGVGSAFEIVPLFWPEMHHTHNGYLRVFVEVGTVGLVIFVAVMAWQFWDIRRQIRQTDGIVREAFAGALMGITLLLLTSATDNTISYNLGFNNPLFALLGAAYGVSRREQGENYGTADDTSRDIHTQWARGLRRPSPSHGHGRLSRMGGRSA